MSNCPCDGQCPNCECRNQPAQEQLVQLKFYTVKPVDFVEIDFTTPKQYLPGKCELRLVKGEK